MRESKPPTAGARAEQKGCHRSGQSEIDGDHFGPNVLDGVVDGQSSDDRPTGGVDV